MERRLIKKNYFINISYLSGFSEKTNKWLYCQFIHAAWC